MVRDVRIKTYTWTGSPTMFVPATNHLDVYTDHSLNGTLKAIQFVGGNYTATGSFQITLSGTAESIISMVSGTAWQNIGAGFYVFPKKACVNNNISGLALTFEDIPLFGVYRLTVSGATASKSGATVSLWYI